MAINILMRRKYSGEADKRPFQICAWDWLCLALGRAVARNKRQRALRFIEEAIELAQALGLGEHEIVAEARKVYSQPAHGIEREIGGVLVTLAVLCEAHTLNMERIGDDTLNDNHKRIDQIREKQRGKST